MQEWNRPESLPNRDALREQVDDLMTALKVQQQRVKQIQQELAVLRIQAGASDGLVEVTVDADGTVVQTRVTAKAMRSRPEKLESAFSEAV